MWESRRSCEISKGQWEVWETGLWFSMLSRPVISTARFPLHEANRGGIGDSLLQRAVTFVLAAAIFRAHSVSLICVAVLARPAKLTPVFRYCFASGSDRNFSYGVANL